MKKILLVLISIVFISNAVIAYSPSSQDIERIEKINDKLLEIINGDKKELRNFHSQLWNIQDAFSGNNSRIHFMASELRKNLDAELDEMKKSEFLNGKFVKQDFVNQYSGNIIKEHTIPQRCWDRWEFLDDLSFVHNLPTAITVATWYAETTCGFYLPINPIYGSNGPFQIISKDYGTGEMTEPLFRQTAQDFVDFTRGKINSYERANRGSGLKVNLSYSDFDRTGVVRHGALYNGLSGRTIMGDIQPMKRRYVFNNYEEDYSGAVRHGLMPMFIKTLERELENVYPKILDSLH